MRIRTLLVLMAAAVLLPVVLASVIALEKIRDGERKAALRGLQETARATALVVDREAQGALSALKALGGSEHLQTGNFRAFHDQAAAQNRLPDVWTLLLDDQGRQILNTIVPYGSPLPAAAARERVARVLATGKPLVTDLILGPVTNRMLTTIYVPAQGPGGRPVVVAQAFSIDHWRNTALAQQIPPDWIVAVIDRQGKFIARSHRPGELLGQQARAELVAAAARADSGQLRHSTTEGIDAYVAFKHSELTGWTIAIAAPSELVDGPARRAMLLALGGLATAVLAAMLAAAAFGHRFIRAIGSAGQAAMALGRGERPVVRPTALHEVDALNQALVGAGELLDGERRSRQAAESERERLLAGEMTAREAAQAQNVAKDQFLAMLGHELRNPLAAISGAISLLEMGGLQPEREGRYRDIIRRQNRHLAHIINDLLDVSRLMAGKITLERQPLDLAECVDGCVESLRATERAIGFRIVVRAAPVWVDGDAVRIEQILNNLITNALKFSPAGSEVYVEVGAQGDRALVSVHDFGVGIDEALLPHVFDPFFQGPQPPNRAQGGLGIGLALVRQLTQLHGGDVSAASDGPGRGSRFGFWLPRIEAPVDTAPRSGLIVSTRRTLVYVEDNEDARATMAELLRSYDYEVVEVPDGKGVLPAVLATRPHAVLLDIGLPDIDGYEVARRLRSHPSTQFVPLIALTGYGQLRDKKAAALAGFDAHLVKPVEPARILETVEDVLARAAALEDRDG
jgi:signal transduction histidine kinase/ActR/RegA family two-component response regulator